MEPDELKQAWQLLDRRLQHQNAIQLQLFAESRLGKVRTQLRPLFWGQLVQMLFGLPFVVLAACLWLQAGSGPMSLTMPLLAAGVFVHVYGVLTIVLAGCTLGLIQTIDYASPVLAIQKQLARLRRFYVVNGMIAGLSWWLMWIPVLMVLSGVVGVDLYARAPSMVWIGLGIGVAGLLITAWFLRWSRSPKRPHLARAVEDGAAGGSLRKAQSLLNDIRRFEQE